MTIGKNSRKSSTRSSIRAPKFLDKSSGFYGRLDEPELAGEVEEQREWKGTEENVGKDMSGEDQKGDADVFDFNEGMMEDDGETLLQRNSSRRSSRWRRSSRRKQKERRVEEDATQDETPTQSDESPSDPHVLDDIRVTIEKEGQGKEPVLVHFTIREEKDDQVLIRDKKRGREEEEEEERKMRREQEEGMKMVKRNSMKNYRKALDRAFRRGWEAFVANLYSVTLTPVTSSSPPSSSPFTKKREQHSSVLAEFQ
ncbi:cilia- and flagella-associated protein 251 [Xyrichtys novacula]|uniref:Cilia- and flagella-associated protein 251 n=1 Tax=Xyrichtys novacula TaxID=13765 RepID=A0AAV1HNN0_XYRNO|nr:cilia- and flagella-associated protein 251 [Xyrichtys novacula]